MTNVIQYLEKLITTCEKYEPYSAYGTAVEDFQEITLQDAYISPSFLYMKELPSIVHPGTNNLIYEYNHIFSYSGGRNKFTPPSPVFSSATNKLFFIPSGCGKTTLAKMYTLQYAYKKLASVSDISETDLGIDTALFPEFSFIEVAFPVLIHGNDVNIHCPAENAEDFFENLILASIRDVLDDPDETRAKAIYDSQDKVVLILDDFHCIMENDVNPDTSVEHSLILGGLKKFIQQEKVLTYLFADFPLNCLIDEFAEDNDFARYTVPSLSTYEGVAFVTRFSEHWYRVIGKAGNRVLSPEHYLRPFLHNATLLANIRSLKELSMLLTISVYDSFLPTNMTKMIGKLLEAKIREIPDSDRRFRTQDVISHLSEIAYYMQCHNTDSLTELELNSIFANPDKPHLSELNQFIVTSRLLQQTGKGYGFTLCDEKEYLIALGIKNHWFTHDIKESRFDYIKEHLVKNHIRWQPIIRHLAVLDEKLRKQIMDLLLQLTDNAKSYEGFPFILLMLKLLTSTDIVILNSDLERFIRLTAGRKSNWALFSDNKTEWAELFRCLSPKKKTIFISTLIDICELYSDADVKKAYCQAIRRMLLFCLYQSDALSDIAVWKPGCKTFFAEADAETIALIFFSCTDKQKNQLLIEFFKKSDCDLVAATIEAVTIDAHPIESALRLLEESSASAHSTAINILHGVSSVSVHDLWMDHGQEDLTKLYLKCHKNRMTEFITSQLLNSSPSTTASRHALEETYVNFCNIYYSFVPAASSALYDIQIFRHYLTKAITRWKNEGLLTPQGEYWNEFKIIACFFDHLQPATLNSLVTEKEALLQMLQTNSNITRQTPNAETFLLSLQLQMLLLILTNPKYYTHSANLRETLVRYYVQNPLYINGKHSYTTLDGIRIRLHNELRNWAVTESNLTD